MRTSLRRSAAVVSCALLAAVPLSACTTTPASQFHSRFGAIEELAVSGPDLWVLSQTGPSRNNVELTELNAQSGRLIRIIPGRGYGMQLPLAIATTPKSLWVSYSTARGSTPSGPGAVAEIDSSSGQKLRLFHIGGDLMEVPTAMAVGGRRLWLLSSQCTYCGFSGVLAEVDAATGRVEHVANPEGTPSGIALSHGFVWVPGGDIDGEGAGGGADNAVTVVSQTTGAIVRVVRLRSGIPLDGGGMFGCGSSGIAATSSAVWVADSGCVPVPDGAAAMIDPSTARIVRSVRNSYNAWGGLTGWGDSTAAVAIANGLVWLADTYGGWKDEGVVVELDAETGALIRVKGDRRDAFDRPGSIAATRNVVWIASGTSLTELGGQTGDVIRTISTSGAISN